MDFLASSSRSGHRKSVLLAPAQAETPKQFSTAYRDSEEHGRLLAEAQRLRGRVYLADGAIEPWQLTWNGRHLQAADHRSFHLLTLDDAGKVVACTRYLPHASAVGFSQLGVFRTPLAEDGRRGSLEKSVESELARARKLGYLYVEMGGWAITEELRCTTEAVRMVVTIYALARLMGGALGISTVTTRHASSSILRRLGGSSLISDPGQSNAYYDPNYRCEMEILRFDSDHPSETYEGAIQRCQNALARTPVIHRESKGSESEGIMTVPAYSSWAPATA
jgi:hypothetical protein